LRSLPHGNPNFPGKGRANSSNRVPPYTAEEAGLSVFCCHGRWLVLWRKLEVPGTEPEEEQWELLRVCECEDEPGSVYFTEF
jgi:hypothetical protein